MLLSTINPQASNQDSRKHSSHMYLSPINILHYSIDNNKFLPVEVMVSLMSNIVPQKRGFPDHVGWFFVKPMHLLLSKASFSHTIVFYYLFFHKYILSFIFITISVTKYFFTYLYFVYRNRKDHTSFYKLSELILYLYIFSCIFGTKLCFGRDILS